MDSKTNLQWVVRQEALTPSVVKRGPRGQGQPQPLRPDEVAPAVGSREQGKLFHVSFVDHICLYLLYYYQYMISSHFTDSLKLNF